MVKGEDIPVCTIGGGEPGDEIPSDLLFPDGIGLFELNERTGKFNIDGVYLPCSVEPSYHIDLPVKVLHIYNCILYAPFCQEGGFLKINLLEMGLFHQK